MIRRETVLRAKIMSPAGSSFSAANVFAKSAATCANPAGGVDWIAVMTARMKGWTTRSFAEKRFHHHRSMGRRNAARSAALFSYGEKDYYLGGSPVWQLFRVTYRMAKKPLFLGGLRSAGRLFLGGAAADQASGLAGIDAISPAEQMKKLKASWFLLPIEKSGQFRVAKANRTETELMPFRQKYSLDRRKSFRRAGKFHRLAENYGEISWDHQSFFAGPIGRRAKALYYQNKFSAPPRSRR